MFSSEDGAYQIIEEAIAKYEKHFNLDFPLYEYIHITKNDHYDFSLDGAENLLSLINKQIEVDEPVEVPKDYFERRY